MVGTKDELLERLADLRGRIERSATAVGRDPGEVTLVAAAKTVAPEVVGWVVDAGVDAVGENYVQELRDTRAALPDRDCRWHFIGTLQSSTAHHVADLADVVETVAGERAARRLAGRAARGGKVLDVLIEVDYTRERSGVPPEGVPAFAELLEGLDGIRLRGLMTLPPFTDTAEEARPWFAGLRGLRDDLREKHPDVLDLSMGMSLDYPVAIQEGATMVRIGTALFGERAP